MNSVEQEFNYRQEFLDKNGITYSEYLQSDWWKTVRKMKLEEQGCCVACGSGHYLHIHHKTYERLGKEELSDLEVLCKDCHDMLHEICKSADLDFSESLDIVKNGYGEWVIENEGIRQEIGRWYRVLELTTDDDERLYAEYYAKLLEVKLRIIAKQFTKRVVIRSVKIPRCSAKTTSGTQCYNKEKRNGFCGIHLKMGSNVKVFENPVSHMAVEERILEPIHQG